MHESLKFYLNEAAWIIGTIVAIITGLTVIWRKVLHPFLVKKFILPFKDHCSNIASLANMAPQLQEILPKLGMVVKAVLPNNGSSMPDALSRLEISVAALAAQNDATFALSEAMLWNHPKAIFQCDDKGSNTFVNNAYARLLTTNVEDLIGLNWRSYVHPDDLLKYDSIWKQAFEEKRACWFHIRMIASDGEIIPVSVQFTVLRTQNKFCGFLGMVDLHPDH
jgi:PAS domain S-box-containing protein